MTAASGSSNMMIVLDQALLGGGFLGWKTERGQLIEDDDEVAHGSLDKIEPFEI